MNIFIKKNVYRYLDPYKYTPTNSTTKKFYVQNQPLKYSMNLIYLVNFISLS